MKTASATGCTRRPVLTDSNADTRALERYTDDLERRLALAHARLAAVDRTLAAVGAPSHDTCGVQLNTNGRLTEWLHGTRTPGWIGSEGRVIDTLRAR